MKTIQPTHPQVELGPSLTIRDIVGCMQPPFYDKNYFLRFIKCDANMDICSIICVIFL
jgi:hypothetical protein